MSTVRWLKESINQYDKLIEESSTGKAEEHATWGKLREIVDDLEEKKLDLIPSTTLSQIEKLLESGLKETKALHNTDYQCFFIMWSELKTAKQTKQAGLQLDLSQSPQSTLKKSTSTGELSARFKSPRPQTHT